MARRKAPEVHGGLFDAVEIEDDKTLPEYPHRHEAKTDTVWPGKRGPAGDGLRMTWTCLACGRIRGRII